MKMATAHQPNYLPWIGLFSKINLSDCFVIADTFEMGNQSVFNKNKIRTSDGWIYLSVPVGRKSERMVIHDIRIPEDDSWREKHWQTIYRNYSKAAYFRDYGEFFRDLYAKDCIHLCQMNIDIIMYLLECFEITVEVVRASDLVPDLLPATECIAAFTEKAGADIYLSGPSGRNYLRPEVIADSGIGLKYFKFEHPIYRQRYSGFEYYMSAIDLLFNMGPRSHDIITASGSIED